MLWRSNKGKNKPDDQTENRIALEDYTKEELLKQNADAKKMFDDIRNLREKVTTLKETELGVKLEAQPEEDKAKVYLNESDEIIAAKKAILERARKDAEEKKAKQQEILRKEQEAKAEQQRLMEAEKRIRLIKEEAERKRLEAIEAEKRAKEVSRKIALEEMEAEIQARKKAEAEAEAAAKSSSGLAEVDSIKAMEAIPQQMQDYFNEKIAAIKQEADLEQAKQGLLSMHEEQSDMLGNLTHEIEQHAEKLTEEQQQLLDQQQKYLEQEQANMAAVLEEQKAKRLESIQKEQVARKQRAEKSRIEKLQREEKLRLEREERRREREKHEAAAAAARAERKAKIKAKRAARLQKAAEKERLKKAKKEAAERARLEKKRLEQKSIADAELGGGIVNVKGLTISTEIKNAMNISLRDLFGIKSKHERLEKSEAKQKKLKKEREQRTQDARAVVHHTWMQKIIAYEKSTFGKAVGAVKRFCDKNKTRLLTVFGVSIVLVVGAAGIVNYYTAYEYSYNGNALGLVKNKDDVLRITDLVQNALTVDKNQKVIIDAKDDIEFKRVMAVGNVEIDTSEDVLKRLTYMGDLNVKAYGIYINNKKVGAVESKEVAAEVMQEIKDKYCSDIENSQIEEAVFIEDVNVRESNTDIQDVATKDEMVDILCTSGQKETLHKVVAGETLAEIAKLYSMEEKELLASNEGVDPKKLVVGTTLVIKQNAPVLTVRITEKVTYDKKIEYVTEKKNTDDLYEGYTETKQEGKNGLTEITSRIVLVNGEQIQETPLATKVKKEPVNEIILIGTKERPPTVGSGKYIWPFEGGYSLTSPFGYRWGRLHTGIDLGTPVGNDVLAADGGTVIKAGYSGAYGYLIIIDHQNGMSSYYAHNSRLLVSAGDKVFQGQHIAESGNTGRSTGPHLHFEIRVNNSPKNPINYLP